MSTFIIINPIEVDSAPCILLLKLAATLVTKKSGIMFKQVQSKYPAIKEGISCRNLHQKCCRLNKLNTLIQFSGTKFFGILKKQQKKTCHTFAKDKLQKNKVFYKRIEILTQNFDIFLHFACKLYTTSNYRQKKQKHFFAIFCNNVIKGV